MTLTDKEKIEEALRLIEKLSIHKKFVHGLPFKDLEEIKDWCVSDNDSCFMQFENLINEFNLNML